MEELKLRKPRNPDGKLRDADDLGSVIRKRRIELGLTQVQLADACACSPRFIGELERGVAGGNIKQVIHVCIETGTVIQTSPGGSTTGAASAAHSAMTKRM